MKNKLDTILENSERPLLMAHFVAGYPTVSDSLSVAEGLIAGGAHIIELQIPFSDPLADGPTIMVASEEAIRNGAHISDAFTLAEKLSVGGAPIVIMSYINPIFRYGIRLFVEAAQKAGVSGLIVPDAPFDTDEGKLLLEETKRCNIHLILVTSPGVSRERLEVLAPHATGFVYCTSRQGVTGADSKFATDLETYMNDMREIFKLPVGLGFGIKTREDVLDASKLADIVIAGSVFVETVKREGVGGVADAVRSLLN